eukprot:Rhum_TRINITY_DN14300_c7_g1::Rhum_TRINITY_DN14300_c7_g1_i1::g.79671::m.79671
MLCDLYAAPSGAPLASTYADRWGAPEQPAALALAAAQHAATARPMARSLQYDAPTVPAAAAATASTEAAPLTEDDYASAEAVCRGEAAGSQVPGPAALEEWKVAYAARHVRRTVEAFFSSSAAASAATPADILPLLATLAATSDHYHAHLCEATCERVVSGLPTELLGAPGGEAALRRCLQASSSSSSAGGGGGGATPEALGRLLRGVGLHLHPSLPALCEDLFTERLAVEVKGAEERLVDGEYADEVTPLLAFTSEFLDGWLERVLVLERGGDPAKRWRKRCEEQVHTALGRVCCRHYFDILVPYPESAPALGNLKACLVQVPSLYPVLVAAARAQLESRLLQAGAFTEDIIEIYVNAMNAADTLFPGQYKAVDALTSGVQTTLRRRHDGATLFVLGLINDDNTRLSAVLHPELHAKPQAGGAGAGAGGAGGG